MKKIEKCSCGEKACVKKQGKPLCKWCVVSAKYWPETPKQHWVRVAKPSAY